MGGFEEREKAFEAKFFHEEDVKFKAMARRNKLLGLWAAEKMGLDGDAAATYARDVVAADFIEVGDEDVYRKVAGDLKARGLPVSEHEIRHTMVEFFGLALAQVRAES